MTTPYDYTTEEGGLWQAAEWQDGDSELALREYIDEHELESLKFDPDKGWLLPFDGRLVHSIRLPKLGWRWDAYSRMWGEMGAKR